MHRARLIRQHTGPFLRYACGYRSFTAAVCRVCWMLLLLALTIGDPLYAVLIITATGLAAQAFWFRQVIPAYRASRRQVYDRSDMNWGL
jgi:hypothetical protein